MKRVAKALVIARIKEREKIKPHTWDHRKAGPWDRRARKAGGGSVTDVPSWDETQTVDSSVPSWDETSPVGPAPEAADHGLSERQKLSPLEKAISPITSYPETYSRMNREAREQISRGMHQIANPDSLIDPQAHGISDVATGIGNVAFGGLGYVASPISAAYRSIAGQPVEDVTGIPREYTEFAAQLATPGIGLPKIGEAPALPSVPQVAPKVAPNDVVSAADRISQVAPSPVNVPRAFASDNIAVQRAGQLARNVPLVGDSIPRATGEMVDQLGDSVKSIASHYGEGSGPNVANRIGRGIGEAAEAETSGTTNAARASDDALLADWQRAQDSALTQVGQHETNALAHARQLTGDMSPQDMGQALITRLRVGEQEARALKDRLYETAGASDASVRPDSVQGAHDRIFDALHEMGRDPDPVLTPAATRMMGELRNFSNPDRVGPGTPVNALEMERTRKRLVNMSQAASNDADRAASNIIMHQFNDWQADAYDNALFSGSPEALQSFRDARAANASWRQRFYNDRDDADKIINKVVTGEVTPQEMTNWIVGSSQVGSKGVSSRLLTRLAHATGNDPEAMAAIRSGVANRLFGTTEGVAAKNPEKVANDIHEFFNGSGRDVATRLYTTQQRQAALNYAATLRRAQEARQTIAEAAKNSKPSPMRVDPGPMQELATSILGKNGKSDEALFSAIDAYARSGGRGDIQTLADIVRNIPEKDKGDLAGAIVRKLGYSDQAKGFSPEKFATEWAKYTPQAKSVLFGNAGAHRQALDDIATIAQRYKEVGRRFGNPAGTAQNVAGFGMITAIIAHPLVAIPSLIGGAVFAKMLSAPASAVKTSNLLKASLAMSVRPTAQKLAIVAGAANSFAKSAERLGSNISAPDFMRQLQGPVPTRAQDKQNQPNRVGQ